MSVRLRSETDYNHTISLNGRAWQSMLDLAGTYGWSPMGTVRPEILSGLTIFDREIEENADDSSRLASGLALGSYAPRTDRMVLLEDALNLADALDRAFVEREPARRHQGGIVYLSDWEAEASDVLPGLGVMQAVVEMCRQGPFWIELY
jgi:hypothetical protein